MFSCKVEKSGTNLLRKISTYEKRLEKLVDKTADLITEKANANYEAAVYAGTKENSPVQKVPVGDMEREVVAGGESVLFIEFGTGVMTADSWEARADLVNGNVGLHGEFGDGNAQDPFGWWYTGYMPEKPPTGTTLAYGHKHTIHTYGQDGQPFLYDAKTEVKEQLPELMKEVFK